MGTSETRRLVRYADIEMNNIAVALSFKMRVKDLRGMQPWRSGACVVSKLEILSARSVYKIIGPRRGVGSIKGDVQSLRP